MRRVNISKTKDPIAPHAARLVSYMNTHPETILAYAKYFGKVQNAVSARMTDMDSDEFVVLARESDGTENEVHIRFKNSLKSYEQVRPVLTDMAKEAEEALSLPSTRPPPMPSENFTNTHTPFNPPESPKFFGTLIVIVFFIVLTYYPSPAPEVINTLRSIFGQEFLRGFVLFIVGCHIIEALIVIFVLAKRGENDLMTWILEVNFELIRVCIDYHTNKWPNEESNIYKMRLQTNLAYLAMVADEYNGNPRNKVKPKVPDLSPLPVPRGSCGQSLNNLIQQAVQIFSDYKKFHRSDGIPTTISSNANNISHTSNNVTSNISPNTISDAGASTSPRQYKLPTSSSIMGSVLPSSSQYQQMYQKQQLSPQQQIHPPQQLQQQISHQQQHAQQQQSSNRFSGSIAPSATMAASNANNGQGTGILPSLIGFTGFMSGGNSGMSNSAGFGATNAFGMVRYPSANGSGVMNNGGIGNNEAGLAGNNNMGNNGIGVNSLPGNGYGSNSLASNTSGLPNMLNHDNGIWQPLVCPTQKCYLDYPGVTENRSVAQPAFRVGMGLLINKIV
ncbi:24145_t:CDS:2, partial [Dentiscutata erythropus]